MKVSKRFRWEAAHRLPWHDDGCQHLHGHSYILWLELDGAPDEGGMVIDFKEIKKIIKPLIDKWDHSILVAQNDERLLEAIQLLDSKHYVLPYDTTSENLCLFVCSYLKQHAADALKSHQITRMAVRIQETETCYAELEHTL